MVFSVFRVIRSGSVNNTSGSDMFCTNLQDPLRYFLHFGPGADQVFRFGFGSDFGFRIMDFMLTPNSKVGKGVHKLLRKQTCCDTLVATTRFVGK